MNSPPVESRVHHAVRRRVGAAALEFLIAVLLAGAVGLAIPAVPAVEEFDRFLVDAANSGLSGTSVSLAMGIDTVFDPVFAVLLAALAALGSALLRRSVWAGARAGALVIVPWGIIGVLKLVVRRPRPEAEMLVHQIVPLPDSFSYPSGHTAVAAAFCLAILLSLPAGWGRRVGVALAVLVIAITAWSRVALGLHHPTDVLVSALLAPTLGILLARMLDALPLGDLRR